MLVERLICGREATKPRYVAWASGFFGTCALFKVEIDGKWTVVIYGSNEGLFYLNMSGISASKSNWILYDAIRPLRQATIASALLISSPCSEDTIYSDYKKGNCKCLYMPVWSSKEMFEAQKHIYDIPLYRYKALLEVFGGILRHVFEEEKLYVGLTHDEVFTNALRTVKKIITGITTMDRLRDVRGEVFGGVPSNETYYIMHLYLDPFMGKDPSCSYSIDVASHAVEEAIMSLIEKSEKERQELRIAMNKNDF